MNRLILYARKSQDRSDRQVASIDGQITEMKQLAKRNGYIIVDVLIEQKSAKKPGRPVFNEMIKRLQKGEADGILCWKLNRLARNPIDAGTISWLLQGNIIQAIHSKERTYLPTDNVLMMQIDFGIANQYIKDLSSDSRRGTCDKADNGWIPQSILPIGYLHHPEKQNAKRQIICDPVRFPIIKELWKLMLTGAYSVVNLKQLADQMGLRNRNGNKYALNTFHLLFRNPVYYGKFYWNDREGKKKLYNGKHTPAVTEIEFHKVQEILNKGNIKTRKQKYNFTYRGLISCGECGGHVTAERKHQVICTGCKHKYSIRTCDVCPKCNTSFKKMENPSVIDVVYYKCTKKINPRCTQKTVTEHVIEQNIIKHLETVSIAEKLYNWAKDRVEYHAKRKHEHDPSLVTSLVRQKRRVEEKLEKLLDLQIEGDITKEQNDRMTQKYQKEIHDLESAMYEKQNACSVTIYDNNRYLDFANNCVIRFKNGDQKIKKELCSFFCSNLTIHGKSLYFSTKKAPSMLDSLNEIMFTHFDGSNLKSA